MCLMLHHIKAQFKLGNLPNIASTKDDEVYICRKDQLQGYLNFRKIMYFFKQCFKVKILV